jgi:quercetin dioxygenase-like cupin family protein
LTGKGDYVLGLVVQGVAVLGLAAAVCLLFKPDAPSPNPHAGAMHMAEFEAGAETDRPATSVKRLSCEKLPDIPGKSITTAIVTFPPDAYTSRHRHPGSVTAVVLKGTPRSQLAGAAVGTYATGQTWFEPPGAVHLFAENSSAAEPAELLAIFVADDDCGLLTIPD